MHKQLKLYAKINNPDAIRIDDDSLGTVVCEDEHIKEYGGTATNLFIALNVVVLLWIITLSLLMACSIYSKISSAMEKEQNHANFAALALIGLVFSTLVLVPDIVALVLVYQGKQEFSNNSQVALLYLVLIFDALGALVAWVALCALCCLGCYQRSNKLASLLPVKLSLGAMCFAPTFFVASHSGYIIIAYVYDTQQAGSATSWCIISFFYFFISFRQLYKIWSTNCRVNENSATFNLSAFIIETLFAIPLIGAGLAVITILVFLPATLTAVSTNIYHIAQLAFVIITGLIAYKFIYTEDEPKQFVKALVETYQKNKLLCPDNPPNAEKAGRVLGGLAFVITKQYTEDESKQLMKAFVENYKPTHLDEVLHASTNAESVGKLFGRLAFTIKYYTDELMEAFVTNFKATNPEGLRLDEPNNAAAAGRMLGKLAFVVMNQYTEDEPKQLLKAFVENFKNTNLGNVHPDNLRNAKKASKVFGQLAFDILQQYRQPNGQDPDEEVKKVFVETFEELHSVKVHNAKAAGNVLATLAFRNIHRTKKTQTLHDIRYLLVE